MKINKQGNLYTVIYVAVIVLVVGTALAFTSLSLKQRQEDNIAADKMQQILASAHLTAQPSDIISTFDRCITGQRVYKADGQVVGSDAFGVDVTAEVNRPAAERLLPVYLCEINGSVKFIVPLYGQGLWGPIWGYVSFDSDGSTVYGAYFSHQGETPGLGAEIAKPQFSDQFDGKKVWKEGRFIPIDVVKKGTAAARGADYVDGISGGTITSRGVASMLSDCLTPYSNVLKILSKEFSNGQETK